MSSREPLWYCHGCNAEMRPLMVPDPVCASCHGSFVEKMENPTDDPREFHRQGGRNVAGDDFPFGLETFMSVLQGMANHGGSESRHTTEHRHNGARVMRTVEIRSGSGPTRTIRVSNPGEETPDQPSLTEFLQRRPSEGPGNGIAGPLMARYLMALLGRDNLTELFGRGMGDGLQPGRMGDYVFNQEALDQILTQLMEQSNSSRPVPATEEIMEKLPREVLEIGSATLEKDCAVCKEQFKLGTEDPDEQVVVTLPCKHPFHEPCILPWLNSSGTCPVCRHALVPQPEHHGPPPRNGNGNGSGTRPRSPSGGPGAGPGPGPGGAFFQSLFGSSPGGSTDGAGSARRRAASDTPRNHIPGGWEEELD